jgi:hypothetical protein
VERTTGSVAISDLELGASAQTVGSAVRPRQTIGDRARGAVFGLFPEGDRPLQAVAQAIDAPHQSSVEPAARSDDDPAANLPGDTPIGMGFPLFGFSAGAPFGQPSTSSGGGITGGTQGSGRDGTSIIVVASPGPAPGQGSDASGTGGGGPATVPTTRVGTIGGSGKGGSGTAAGQPSIAGGQAPLGPPPPHPQAGAASGTAPAIPLPPTNPGASGPQAAGEAGGTITPPSPDAVGAVPEPATWLSMTAGFLIAGWVLRRSRVPRTGPHAFPTRARR